jgi:hypothetical protein
MTEHTVRVQLDLRIDGDALSGQAACVPGGVRSFSGFIGLVAAIDALIEEARNPIQKETSNAGH